ncbi:MAG: glycosyltransferase family 2 protein [Chloroflexi bacterium]|nr:glycosyltransferase family 2 protein [Chloroflexota bacterium]
MGAPTPHAVHAGTVAESQAGSAPFRPLLSVIVPTFNERDNVPALVERLSAALESIEYEIVFVDDSTDDTPQVIAGLRSAAPIRLIHREADDRAGGLTTALVRGLREGTGRYVASIDADLQHPPEKLREMLDAARTSGADVVVASRYRAGGSARGLSGPARRAISIASKWLSKVLFYERLQHTSDPGSGFFLLRRGVIDGAALRPVGYKMLTEILVRGTWHRLVEVPYRFEARSGGQSKAGFRQGVQYLQHTARIFIEVPHVARAWKFGFVGATGVVVNLAFLWSGLSLLSLAPLAAWALGVEASILSNYGLNRSLTWRDRRQDGVSGWLTQGASYHATSVAGIAANFVVFGAASLLGAVTFAAAVAGLASGTAMNFIGASRLTFAPARRVPIGIARVAALRRAPEAGSTADLAEEKAA